MRRTPGDADKLLAKVRAKRCTRNPNSCAQSYNTADAPEIPLCGLTGGECPHEPKVKKQPPDLTAGEFNRREC